MKQQDHQNRQPIENDLSVQTNTVGKSVKLRRKRSGIFAYCSSEVVAEIKKNAADCNQSVSSFLVELGRKHKPTSTLDAELILKMFKINGDLGRLGGIFKLTLFKESSTQRLSREEHQQIKTLINDLAVMKDKMSSCIHELNHKIKQL